MSSRTYESNGYVHDLNLLIISRKLHVFIFNEKWVQGEKHLNNTHVP